MGKPKRPHRRQSETSNEDPAIERHEAALSPPKSGAHQLKTDDGKLGAWGHIAAVVIRLIDSGFGPALIPCVYLAVVLFLIPSERRASFIVDTYRSTSVLHLGWALFILSAIALWGVRVYYQKLISRERARFKSWAKEHGVPDYQKSVTEN